MEEYLSSFRQNENVYYLNKQGRERVGATKICKKNPQVSHYLMRNTMYIQLNCPSSWKNEIRIKTGKDGELQAIADAKYEENGVIHIVEIDCTQKMIENRNKIKRYKEIVKYTGRDFFFHWVTTTHHRQKQLQELSEGLQTRVNLIQDFI
ncbi:conserved hypothetical protein [Bacillus sp. 349Y]|nr:conserved hypothetical protein [Bacillus sp. 349Y]